MECQQQLQPTYQIKSSPFMRRMVSTSTKNGELQRLKQEYERIKSFNERTIEKQMRHSRLRRLYRVIEIIKETQPERVRARMKTEEQLRAMMINKARQLGQEYSRRNAVRMQHNSCQNLVPRREHLKFSFEQHNPKEEAARRNRTTRRIIFGNLFSRKNRDNIGQGSVARMNSMHFNEPEPDPVEEKRQLLFKRIKYGNNCSSVNLVNLQRVKHTMEDNHKDMAQLEWLDSIAKDQAPQWQRNQPSLSSSVLRKVVNVEQLNPTTDELDENTIQADEQVESATLVSEPELKLSETESIMVNPETTVCDESVEEAVPLRKNEPDNKLQQITGFILNALQRPFVLMKSEDTKVVEPKFEEPTKRTSFVYHRKSSVDRVILEDIYDEEDEQSVLHHVSNSTNLQSIYRNDNVTDLNESSSAFILPPSISDDALSPDELVLSCQRYVDNISEADEMRARRTSIYNSSIIKPSEKVMDLRAKILKSTNEATDKDQLQIAQELRSIFEH